MTARRPTTTRARIAAAALDLLREKGASGLSMRQVAARTGLALSNVQYHYSSREQLLVGLTEHHLALCQGTMDRALARAGRVDLRSVLQVSLLDDEVRQTAAPFRELFALALAEPLVHELLMAHYRRAHAEFTELLGSIAPSRALSEVSEAAGLVMASIEGAYLLHEATGISLEATVDRLENLLQTMLGLT